MPTDPNPVRRRILDAAFSTFSDGGYAATSTHEIATRAKTSKRDLCTVVGNKHELLVPCITDRAAHLSIPSGLPAVGDRETLERWMRSHVKQAVRASGRSERRIRARAACR